MIEFYKRVWQASLVAFAGSMGTAAALFKDNQVGFFIMLGVAIIFLVLSLIGICNDYRDVRSKKRSEKQKDAHKALIKSFKELYIKQGKSEEEAQKLAEFASEDIPPSPPIEGEEDWMPPAEAYRKSHRKG